MLIPTDIPRYSYNPRHPYYRKDVDRAKLVITLDGVPQNGVWEWSVPDGYIKRRLELDELERRTKTGKHTANSIARFKGKVAVFIET